MRYFVGAIFFLRRVRPVGGAVEKPSGASEIVTVPFLLVSIAKRPEW